MLHGFEDKSAYAMCTFGYSEGPGKDISVFCGKCPGEIVSPRGSTKFGWDPCFQPDDFNETFAEMQPSVKNSISHRARALDKLKSFFTS